MVDLSIIIPARNEKYLANTIEDILSHAEGNIEIIVGIDGTDMSDIAVDRIKCLTTFEPIGQRAMMNRLAREASGEYILKSDGHCSFSQGFDVKMMKDMDGETIMSPYMMKLDAENWQIIPHNPTSMYVFDTDLVMQHWREGANQELINETMIPVGAAFMVTRENYWKWDLCDESLGSWGMQCSELGIKAFLNGGHCVTNKNVYFGHLFREKEEAFPYHRDKEQIRWTKAEFVRRFKNQSIAELIRKFNYPFDWNEEKVKSLPQ